MNQSIRQKIEQYFGLPTRKMNWPYYFAMLNEAGKLTARSTLDMVAIILASIEELEPKNVVNVPASAYKASSKK